MKSAASVALGEIMATKSGSVDPSKFTDEIFDLYSIPAFDKGRSELVAGSEIGSSKQVVQPGDVLLSKIVPHIRRTWVVGANRGHRIIASGEWIVFRSARTNSRYLRQVLVGDPFHAKFMNTVAGVGGSLVRARPAHVAKIDIPLPPLPEQRRIAEVLDRAEALRTKRRAALAQLDSLTQSLFIDLFGDPAKNPKGWPRKSLKALGTVSTGSTPPSSMAGMFDGTIPFVTPGDLEIDQPVKRTVTEAGADECRTVRSGAALVCCIGTIGKMSIATARSAFNQQINAVDWSEEVDDNFGLAALRFFKPTLQAWGASTTVPILKKSTFEKIQIPVPPLPLQQEFARRFRAIEKLRGAQKSSLTELDDLFSSLQSRAFKGEL